jgi:hypothetical protein
MSCAKTDLRGRDGSTIVPVEDAKSQVALILPIGCLKYFLRETTAPICPSRPVEPSELASPNGLFRDYGDLCPSHQSLKLAWL